MGYGFDVEIELQRLAVVAAHQSWTEQHHSTLWDQPQSVRTNVIARTREGINHWFDNLELTHPMKQQKQPLTEKELRTQQEFYSLYKQQFGREAAQQLRERNGYSM